MSSLDSKTVASKDLHFTEIKIPVPWGHIAGKTCGKPTDQHVLAIHGLQDNCGVFDRLFSQLNNDYCVVAIDLPGHGYSSHFPAGLPLSFLNYVVAVTYVIEELRWESFLYMGHSFGGQIGSFLAAMFPHWFQKLIIMDHIAPKFNLHGDSIPSLADWVKNCIKFESRIKSGKPPVYTYAEVLDKMMNRESTLTKEAAQIVLKRSLKKVPGGYSFSMDQRLKYLRFPALTIEIVEDVYQNIRCPTLFMYSTSRFKVYSSVFAKIFKIIDERSNLKYIVIPGNHDFHQNHPERVIKFIDEFFSREQCKL